LEIIALNESEELPDLIRFGLPVDILEIDQFWDIGMNVNMMTAIDTGEPKSKCFRTSYGFGKANIFGTGQQFLE
jgi:hypothetical protein